MLKRFFRKRKYTKEERIVRLFVKAVKKSRRETGAKFIGIRKAD
ncbi:hypothetical protein [Oceanobacillus sp. CAU 1775]